MRRVVPLVLLLAGCSGPLFLGSPGVTCTLSAREVDVFDLLEIEVRVDPPPPADALLSGRFQRAGEAAAAVEGFRDGDVLRIRFMPSKFGEHVYALSVKAFGRTIEQRGAFKAKDVRRRGPVRVDKVYPLHFVWEGTGERFLWNGATADGLPGLDETTMRRSVDRFSALKAGPLRLDPGKSLDRVLHYARGKDVAVALVLDARGAREAVARYAAFSNVTWEAGDEVGPRLRELDPYGHLVAGPPGRDWADVALHRVAANFDGHGVVLEARRRQAAAGRLMPQVVEGAGAWEVAMAGGYGSWGGGPALESRARLAEFLTAAEFWRLEPRGDLVKNQAYALAEPRRRYAVYLPEGRPATLLMEPGRWRVRRFDPRTGAWETLDPVEGAGWTSPAAPSPGDWAYLIDR